MTKLLVTESHSLSIIKLQKHLQNVKRSSVCTGLGWEKRLLNRKKWHKVRSELSELMGSSNLGREVKINRLADHVRGEDTIRSSKKPQLGLLRK